MYRRSPSALTSLLFAFALLLPAFAAADSSGCPAGTHPATADEVPLMVKAGITDAKVGMCWDSNNANVGQDKALAKQDLEGMWCNGVEARCTYRGTTYTSTISGLDANFAVCADKFMQALRQRDPSACIRSAYRSTEHQICACGGNANGIPGKCAAAGHSYHQKGLAIDVNHAIPNSTVWAIAQQYGIENPSGLHSSDPNHYQPVKGSSGCSGSPMPQDVTSDFYASAATPASGVADFIRGLLGGQQQQQAQAQPASLQQQAAQPQVVQSGGSVQTGGSTDQSTVSAVACTPSYSCEGSTYYYKTSQCQKIAIQQCVNGCADSTACAAAPSGSGSNGTTDTTSTQTDASSAQSSTDNSAQTPPVAAIDIINAALAADTSNTASDVATPTPIALNQNIGDISSALGDELSGSDQSAPSGDTQTLSPDASAQASAQQQTFVSGDLANSPASTNSFQDSRALAILESMRQSLLGALTYLQHLRPFGVNYAVQQYAE